MKKNPAVQVKGALHAGSPLEEDIFIFIDFIAFVHGG